jgi:hypothetical protein
MWYTKRPLSSKRHVIYVSSNNVRHPLTKIVTTPRKTSLHFTSLHYTCRHFTSSHLNLTQLHFTSLHYTCRHFTSSHLKFTQLHYTSLRYTCRHFTSSHLNFTQLYFTTLAFSLTPLKFTTSQLHLTSPHFTSFHFTPFIIAFLNMFLKVLGLQRKVPKASAGSWFQFVLVLFTKKHFPISVIMWWLACCLTVTSNARNITPWGRFRSGPNSCK